MYMEGVISQEVKLSTHEHDTEFAAEEAGDEKNSVRVSAVPPTVVQPLFDEDTGTHWVRVPMRNPSSTEDLVIRAGTKIATVKQTEWEDITASDEQQRSTGARAAAVALHPVQHSTVDVDKADWSEQRLAIDRMTGRQIVEYVKAGHVVEDWQHGTSHTFQEWKDEVGNELKFGPAASESFKEEMRCMLYALRQVFAKNPKGPPPIKGVEARIELKDPQTVPVRCKGKRYSPEEKRVVREECQKMLDNGILEASDSPWCAPIVLVRKKDATWRMSINYTASCNPYIKHDAMPIPYAQDAFDGLAEADMLSLWDACAGYWQISLREQDRHLTAFTDGDQLWQFTRCPFGLATSGSMFCRAMERILTRDEHGNILHNICELFVDDGIIHTKEGEDHVDAAARVVQQLRRNGVSIKMSKCLWGTKEAHAIGHHIQCGQGIAADPKKVEDIIRMKRPGTMQVLHSTLGSCVYLARFVKDFAELTGPLYELLKQKKTPEAEITEDMWTPQCDRAFKTLKAALASSPVLAFPDFSSPYIILHDCSKYQLGGALIQLDSKGRERVIAYTSKRLNKTQLGYGVTSKEALGVLHCIMQAMEVIHSWAPNDLHH